MKRIQLFLLISLILVLSSKVIGQITYDLEEANLKGKVKSISTITYKAIDSSSEIIKGTIQFWGIDKYDIDGKLIEKIGFDSNGNCIYKNYYCYEQKENINELFCYNAKDSLLWKITYIYDQKRNIIAWDRNDMDDQSMSNNKYTYKYNKRGKIIKKIAYNDDGSIGITTNYKYDHNLNLLEIYSFSIGLLESYHKTTLKYDQKGRLIEQNLTGKIKIGWTFTYKYDGQGNLIEESRSRTDGKNCCVKFIYKYDIKENRIEGYYYNQDGSLNYKGLSKFDNHDNWILHKNYIGLKNPEIIERKIEYF